MNDPKWPVTDEELHALVDGELAEDRRADVEAWLAAHPQDAERVAQWRTQAAQIRARYAGVADEPVPPRFDLERLGRPQRLWRTAAVAAALAMFVLGGASGWLGRGLWDGGPAAKRVAAEAIDAYKLYSVEVRHPVEVPGAEAAHLVQWLSRRLGRELRAPDLQALGLHLVGGRLLPGPDGAAAFFMYEGPSGERFTLYCSRARAPETALRYRDAGQVAAFYWIEGDLGYAVSGPSDRSRLQEVAETAYEQIDRTGANKPGTDKKPRPNGAVPG